MPEPRFNVVGLQHVTFSKKEILAQVFSCEFCKIVQNSFFAEHLWQASSEPIVKSVISKVWPCPGH